MVNIVIQKYSSTGIQSDSYTGADNCVSSRNTVVKLCSNSEVQ